MKKLLIANRGEIARRIIRTARRMGIATVAVCSDADAQALHVREADAAVSLGGLASADSYLRIDKLMAAARASGADAVHPGYGFLSENADFAQAVLDAGLVWVGPPPEAIRALGNKSQAKRIAREHGVPVLPGYQGEDQANERFVREAQAIGFPLMVKAAAGGGGRGMRLVMDSEGLPAALDSARAEALAGFGSAELLIERALLAPRHVEIQVFADALGGCIHLGERDCSVQRRHQKIVEESPSPAVDATLRARMGEAAVALARAAGYVGAGTVEFLLEGTGFHLMEMNTRLQVEHPVTEMRLGVDLVEWQLRIARGEPLPMTQADADRRLAAGGHAVEVRLCAEDDAFMPRSGRLAHFHPAGGLRFDHALRAGMTVTPYYDSMLGKLIAHAPTRAQAIDALLAGLRHTELLGLPTNRAMLAACLDHPVFREGGALIPFIAGHGDALRDGVAHRQAAMRLHAAAAVVLAMHPARPAGGPGHRLHCGYARPLRLRHGDAVLDVQALEQSDGSVRLTHEGQTLLARRADAHGAGESFTLVVDGLARRAAAVCVDGNPGRAAWHVQIDGTELWLQDLSLSAARQGGGGADAGQLRAPFNGKVALLAVAVGQRVARGDTLVAIESMKLQHNLAAAAAGTVRELLVEPGQQVAPGQVLARLDVEVAA